MALFQDASKKPLKLALFLGVGGVLTILSWVCAGQVSPGRTELSIHARARPRLTPLPPKDPPRRHCSPVGYGGIPYLIRSAFGGIFIFTVALLALVALATPWHSLDTSRRLAVELFAANASFMCCGFIVVFQFLPFLRQLRFLRTLPISGTRLAAVSLALVILPTVALGALAAVVAGLSMGTSAALAVLRSFTFILAPASLAVFLAVWRGDGMLTYALLLVTLFGFINVQGMLGVRYHSPEILFSVSGPIVALSVLSAFLLTRLALLRSRLAYRIGPPPFGAAGGLGGVSPKPSP